MYTNILIILFLKHIEKCRVKNKWITRALKRQNKDKTEWKPSVNDRIYSIHFAGSAYEANSVATLNLGYEFKKKKRKQEGLQSGNPCLKK